MWAWYTLLMGEALHNVFVGPLAGSGVPGVKGLSCWLMRMPSSFRGFVAVAVKLPGEQALSRAEGVGGVPR